MNNSYSVLLLRDTGLILSDWGKEATSSEVGEASSTGGGETSSIGKEESWWFRGCLQLH